MKLELKHLAPYLPYGLKISYFDMGEYTKHELTIEIDTITSKYIGMNSILKNEFFGICQPILRPLSDLTKEIEVDGKKFVPLRKINAIIESEKIEDISVTVVAISDELHFEYLVTVYGRNKLAIRSDYLTINQYMRLFEWHFDVFGLIKEGLAIDINTLKG